MVIPSLLCIIFYLLASAATVQRLLARQTSPWPLIGSAWIALSLHAGALLQTMQWPGVGENFSLLNIASLVGVVIACVLTLLAKPLKAWVLLPAVYLCAGLLQLLNSLLPGMYPVQLTPVLMLHITLALAAFAVLMIACLFTLLLAYLNRRLKARKRIHLPQLPPLLVIEQHIFQLIMLGVTLLTISIAIGALYLHNWLAPDQAPKAFLTIAAWGNYVLLLWGHYRHGWRGRILIGLSLSGSVLLNLAYFGNRLLQDVLLR